MVLINEVLHVAIIKKFAFISSDRVQAQSCEIPDTRCTSGNYYQWPNHASQKKVTSLFSQMCFYLKQSSISHSITSLVPSKNTLEYAEIIFQLMCHSVGLWFSLDFFIFFYFKVTDIFVWLLKKNIFCSYFNYCREKKAFDWRKYVKRRIQRLARETQMEMHKVQIMKIWTGISPKRCLFYPK